MRLSVQWLRDWVRVDANPEALAEQLTTSGLEVDALLEAAPEFEGVVVARVSEVRPHPNAERLKVCTVEDGSRRYDVVCGAGNVAVGARVPLAEPGARLPGGCTIEASVVRDVRSEGMLCSAAELGLGDDGDGLLLLPEDAPLGISLREYLRLDDAILDIDLTPNRGDCMSVLGVAREVAAISGRSLQPVSVPAVSPVVETVLPVKLQAGHACPRFAGRVIRNVNAAAASPLWMRERLRRAGLRPISAVVDVTNYVMLELGQPLHAYDLAKLQEGIEVRLAHPRERLTLLDGQQIELDEDVLVIADSTGAIGMAGIMGGESTAVETRTRDVFLESAFFTPASIAGRARRHGLQTDASQRFERGVDPRHQARAIERATGLLLMIAGGDPGPLILTEDREHLPERPTISLRRNRLTSLLGMEIPPDQVRDCLERLGMSLVEQPDGWRVVPPSFRFDLTLEEDLIEEVGRMVGYDQIPAVPGAGPIHLGTATETRIDEDRLADLLIARGYTEVVTYTFVDQALEELVNPGTAHVRLKNPISQDMGVMRRSLWPGLLQTAKHNLSRQQPRLRLFEIGQQFFEQGGDVRETRILAGLAAGSQWPEQWGADGRDVDFFDVKGDVEALLALRSSGSPVRFQPDSHPALRPGQSARILLGSEPIGWIGTLHPKLERHLDLKRAAVLFALQMEQALKTGLPSFRPYSKFPTIRRDLAVVVEEGVTAEDLVRLAREAGGPLLQNVVVFDVYRGKGVDSRRKSVALGLILQGVSRTLTDADADKTVQSVTHHLERELGATIRT